MATTASLRTAIGALMLSTTWANVALGQDDGQWTRPGKDLGATRYSGLDEITAAKGLANFHGLLWFGIQRHFSETAICGRVR